jgi:hypothetical protein
LPIRPADLTEPHLFAHSPGDLFWWVSRGLGDGAMPGFAEVMKPSQRWDVINFVRARAAGLLARRIGPQVAAAATSEFPDFAFEAAGAQGTLSQLLQSGPVLLVLFAPPVPLARLTELAASHLVFKGAGLNLVAVAIGPQTGEAGPGTASPPLVVDASPEEKSVLALFRAPTDGSETELMLDRGGNVRARWTLGGAGGLPDAVTLTADAERVARLAVAAASHAGHAQ